MTQKTPKEVVDAIRQDLSLRGLRLADVARKMHKSLPALAGNLKGEFRIGAKNASLFNQIFGYSIDFLRNGEGELYGNRTIQEVNPKDWGFTYVFPAEYVPPQEETHSRTFTRREQVLLYCVKTMEKILDNEVSTIPKDNYKGCADEERIIHSQDFNFTPMSNDENFLFCTMVIQYKKLSKILNPARIAAYLNQISVDEPKM